MKTIIDRISPRFSPEARAIGQLSRLEKTLGLVAIAGAAAAVIAALWPSKDDLRWSTAHDPKPPAQEAIVPVAPSTKHEPITAIAPPVEQSSTATEAEALTGKEPALGVTPEDPNTDYEQLALDKLAAGETEEAFVALRKHVFLHAPNPDMLLELGRLGRELKEYAVAELALEEAQKRAPDSSEVMIEQARLDLALGDLDAAQKAARRAIKLDRENGAAWNTAGRIAMEQSQWERAELALRRAVGLEPTDGLIHNNLGLLYIHMKRPTQAVESMEATVELFDDQVPYFVFNNLGLAYELDGKLEQAKDAFEKSLDANPGYARAQANLRRVEAAMNDREELEMSPPDATKDIGAEKAEMDQG